MPGALGGPVSDTPVSRVPRIEEARWLISDKNSLSFEQMTVSWMAHNTRAGFTAAEVKNT